MSATVFAAGVLLLLLLNLDHAVAFGIRIFAVLTGLLTAVATYRFGESVLITVNPAIPQFQLAILVIVVSGILSSLICSWLAEGKAASLTLPALIGRDVVRSAAAFWSLATIVIAISALIPVVRHAIELTVIATGILTEIVAPSVGLCTSRVLSGCGNGLRKALK